MNEDTTSQYWKQHIIIILNTEAQTFQETGFQLEKRKQLSLLKAI